MEQFSSFFAFILLISQIDNSEQGDIPNFCSGSQIVDAASFSTVNRRNLILFSGAYYWELDVDTKRIIRAQKITNVFPGVEENIDAACSVSSYGEGGYMFLKGDKIWTYVGSMNPVLNATVNLYEFAEKHQIKYGADEPGIGCVACFCHDSENCHVILVNKGLNKKSIGCLFNYGYSLSKCQLFNRIQMPERIKEDLLDNIQECNGLTYAMDPEQPTIVVAVDNTKMVYYQNNDLVYSTPIAEVFGCTSSSTIYYAIGGVLLFIIILIMVIIIVWIIKRKLKDEASPLLRETMEPTKHQVESDKSGKKQTGKTPKLKTISKVAKPT